MSFNFNRRPKRVAGPGFYINARYDDFNISKMRGKLGVVSANSWVPPARSAECYDVKEQELLVAMKENSSYHDGHVHVFSAVNGMDCVGTTEEEVKEDILNRVQFIGLAQTEFKSDNKAYMEQGLVCTVGGVETILNDGESDINPGDLVAIDLNLSKGRFSQTRNRGIPREKIRFTVKKADDDLTVIKKCMDKACGGSKSSQKQALLKIQKELKVLRTQRGKLDKNDNDYNTKLAAVQSKVDAKKIEEENAKKACKGKAIETADSMKEFLKLYRLHNDRIIGKAMSFARKGDRFEILLSLRHAR